LPIIEWIEWKQHAKTFLDILNLRDNGIFTSHIFKIFYVFEAVTLELGIYFNFTSFHFILNNTRAK